LSDFGALQTAIRAGSAAAFTFYAFDVLYLDGLDLRGCALADRRIMLETLLVDGSDPIRLSEVLDGGVVAGIAFKGDKFAFYSGEKGRPAAACGASVEQRNDAPGVGLRRGHFVSADARGRVNLAALVFVIRWSLGHGRRVTPARG
jgi:hypothetical protein